MRVLSAIFLCLWSISSFAGFECSDLNANVFRADRGGNSTLVVSENGQERFNPRIELELDESSGYSQRMGVYNTLMTEAQIHFPYMPEFLMIYHVMRSTKLYRKGFVVLEEGGVPVKLGKMYCRAFMNAIDAY